MLEHLLDVADLARCAMVAASWRNTVRTGTWPLARRLKLRSQGDSAAAGLAWAAQRCTSIEEVHLGILATRLCWDVWSLETRAA